MSRWYGGLSKPNGNDRFTKVLLHLDGNLNDDNAGGSTHTWQKVITSLDPTGTAKFGSGAGQFVTGSSQGYTTPAHVDFDLGSSDFSIDFWFRYDKVGSSALAGQCSVGVTNAAWFISASGGGVLGSAPTTSFTILSRVYTGPSTVIDLTGTISSNLSGYHHVEFARSGSGLILFLDGASSDADSISTSVVSSPGNLSVGRAGEAVSTNQFEGLIDEFRLSVGIARHTSSFTPQTRAYSRFI